MEEGIKVTPMMKQFLDLKKQYHDCVLLFRAGDFYETFYDDAKIASQVLGITLTKRGETPMAGVPFHSITPYIKKLVSNNYKVALCEQLEDPKQAKGLVKRGVTRVITPGIILEDEYLTSFENNFIMCIYSPKDISEKYAISLVDITTGEFLTSQVSKLDDVKTLIRKYTPSEIVLNESSFVRGLKSFISNSNIYYNFLSDIRFNINYANEILRKQFGFKGEELGLLDKEYSIIVSGALLFYIYKLQKLDLSHINKLSYVEMSSNMVLDSISLRNLEIVESIFSKDKSKTLFGILNNTKTGVGARLLKKNLTNPLLNKKEIEEIYDSIDEFNEFVIERNEIRDFLSDFSDIERITSRINSGIVSPKDLYALKNFFAKFTKNKRYIESFLEVKKVKDIKKLDLVPEIVEILDDAIADEAPAHTRDIGFLKKTYNKELEELFNITYNSKDFISELEEEERLKTGISSLKIRYNRVFGYYLEVPRSQVSKVPDTYSPRQTLTNSQRYTMSELKEKEDLILGAEDKIKELELSLYNELVLKLKIYTKKFQDISSKIGFLDVLLSHSLNSQLYDYVRPSFDEYTQIIEGRNPIVERFVSDFIGNDVIFNENESLKIVTGPNMAGKSTYLRQVALITIMAQSGSFVPVTSAKLKIYNRVFTRIGAHDELSEGQSTFMVEMSETANILNNAKENSLVLLDEIGRGTSTYDGLAMAWAITEELADIGCDTIFATHYHQLNSLASFYPNIENYNVKVREEGDKIEFIRKIEKGGTNKSYGIYVGKLAGIPSSVLDRAKEVQRNIEEKETIRIKQDFKESMSVRVSRKKEKDRTEKGLGGFI